MSKQQVFVRQRDNFEGWAVDVYDGKGKWVRTIYRARVLGDRFTRAEAQKKARDVRAAARPRRSRKTR